MSSPSSSDDPRAILEKAREELVFSGYQYFTENAGSASQGHGGVTSYWPAATPVEDSTYFDIGSVTKAVVTTTLCALAVDRKLADLSQTLGHWVSEWRGTPLGSRTLQDVLCHAAGFIAWKNLAEVAPVGVTAFGAKRGSEWLEAEPGVKTAYSDLGFLALGEAMTRIWKMPLEKAWHGNVAGPLKLTEITYAPVPKGSSVAATEVRDGKPLTGIVFDENSEALGGRTPHAGLFATARGLAPWAREWLASVRGKSKWLSDATARLFITRANRVPASPWALGWDTKSETGSSAGSRFSLESFGHLGYPGCSVWVDPKHNAFAILHTNRVHPSRLDERIRKIRPVFHDSVAGLWGKK